MGLATRHQSGLMQAHCLLCLEKILSRDEDGLTLFDDSAGASSLLPPPSAMESVAVCDIIHQPDNDPSALNRAGVAVGMHPIKMRLMAS